MRCSQELGEHEDVPSGRLAAERAEQVARVAKDDEVGGVNGDVAPRAEVCGVRVAAEDGWLGAELAGEGVMLMMWDGRDRLGHVDEWRESVREEDWLPAMKSHRCVLCANRGSSEHGSRWSGEKAPIGS